MRHNHKICGKLVIWPCVCTDGFYVEVTDFDGVTLYTSPDIYPTATQAIAQGRQWIDRATLSIEQGVEQ